MQTQQTQLDSLCLFLYNRPLHPELFDISREIISGGKEYESRIWITGCSHVIHVHGPDWSLCEVVDDEHAELPKKGLIASMPFRREKSLQRDFPEYISYTVGTQTETMSERVYAETHEELMQLGCRLGSLVCFPRWSSRGLHPFTYISMEAGSARLHTLSFHAFPAEYTITKVQSIFQLNR